MLVEFDDREPIFVQIAQQIERLILNDELQEEKKIPSSTEIAENYKINPATVMKGFGILADKDIIYKKRGVGMFVKQGAKMSLLEERKKKFNKDYIIPLLEESDRLRIDIDTVIEMIRKGKNEQIRAQEYI